MPVTFLRSQWAVLPILISAVILTFPLPMHGEDSPADLAEQAIAARYQVESLQYEKSRAQQTVNGSKRNIESSKKSLPGLRKMVEQLTQEKQKAEQNLKTITAAGKSAKEQTEAERALRLADSKLQREAGRLSRSEEQLKLREQQLADALKAIPEKEAAAKVALKKADALKVQQQTELAKRAGMQNPLAIAKQIDALVADRLNSEKIPASPTAEDAEFLRRVCLDITGTVPKYEDTLAFLESTDSDKRAQLINRLLTEETYGRNFSQRFCTVTTEVGTTTLLQGQEYFNNWLAESLQLNRGWDRIVTDLLAADGPGYQSPGALFTVAYRMNEQPDPALLLGAAGDYFLGLQIKCAQCHDHPFHEWKQNEFWGMAAMFGRVRLKGQSNNGRELDHLVTDADVDLKEMVRMNGIKYPVQLPDGKIAIPDPVDPDKTLATVSAKFLGGDVPQLPSKGNYRKNFADWVTSKDNAYFAKATVNRLWAHFFGRGIVEPIENLHPDFPPTHPKVLKLLTAEFKKSDYDLQYLIRCITLTAAYQRSSKPLKENRADKTLLSHMAVKPLDSYALVDSLWVVLRRTPPSGERRRDAAAVFDTRLPGGNPTKYTHSIPQVLKLMNNRDHVGTNSSTVSLATNGRKIEDAIAHLYLAVLSRHPTPEEAQHMKAYAKNLNNDRQAYADIFWVLLNSAEFLINH